MHNFCKKQGVIEKEIGCYADSRANPDFERLLSSNVGSVAECTQLAFDNSYLYAGLNAGKKCFGSNLNFGKYGTSDICNYKCKDDKSTCGGKDANTVYLLDYTKDKLCGFSSKFDEVDDFGVIIYGEGGILSNPSGDGEVFIWSPRMVEEPEITLYAIRSRDGVVKGFNN